MTDTITTPVLVVVGPTAIGKTALALGLAERFDAEIISVDSMQVFRHMNLGTAKPRSEELARVRHHCIDVVDPDEPYDAARFARDAEAAIRDIGQRGRVALVTGGTGLYLRALLHGLFEALPVDQQLREELRLRLDTEGSDRLYQELEKIDPQSAARLHPHDQQRLLRALEIALQTGESWSKKIENQEDKDGKFKHCMQIGLTCERELLYQRINLRTRLMLDQGLEDEVRGLLAMGHGPELKPMQSIGYRHILNFIHGTWSCEDCERLLARDTRRYAKRQYTWFNREEALHWFDRSDQEGIAARVGQWLDRM